MITLTLTEDEAAVLGRILFQARVSFERNAGEAAKQEARNACLMAANMADQTVTFERRLTNARIGRGI